MGLTYNAFLQNNKKKGVTTYIKKELEPELIHTSEAARLLMVEIQMEERNVL